MGRLWRTPNTYRKAGVRRGTATSISTRAGTTSRILADLREDGEIISRKTVAKTMRKLGLRGVCPKRWKTTTLTDPGDTYPPDAVKRQWYTGVLKYRRRIQAVDARNSASFSDGVR